MKWLQFIIDNAWTVVIIGGVLVQLIQAIRRKKAGEETAADEPPKEYQFDDPELAERTRKIREEIRRKIEQRTRGHVETAAPADEPEAPPVIREVAVRRAPVHASSRLDAQRQAEILEEQATLMEKLREAEFMKAAGKKRAEFEASTADHSVKAQMATRSTVLGDLRTPEALRRAFILREVLGPPVALKR